MSKQSPAALDLLLKSGESTILETAIRMVVPMRREFGRSLDVSHFMHDFVYAQEIIDQAINAENQRLRELATLVHSRLQGPRIASQPVATPAKPVSMPPTQDLKPTPGNAPTPKASTDADSDSPELTESELRARMMSKYRSGLR